MNLARIVAPPLPSLPLAQGWRQALNAWAWVPIRSLAPRHKSRILAHLLALDEGDRYLRFGYPATDEQVARYVDTLDFARDEVFGIFNRRLQLIAMAHLAYGDGAGEASAEFGVSVLARVRGRGYGGRLVEHAMLHARNRSVDTLKIHALSENGAMLRIARRAGATVERAGAESEASLRLPPDTLLTRVSEMMESQAAELDYRLKTHAQRVDRLLQVVAEVKGRMQEAGRTAQQ